MLDRRVVRLAGIGAMAGAVLAVVFNLLHPRPDDIDARAIVDSAVDEGIWSIDHYVLGWTVGLALFALIAIARSFTREPSASWARVALPFAIGSSFLLFATVVVDGWAVREAAEVEGVEFGVVVEYVAEGLFLASIGAFFGLTPVLYGITLLSSNEYPAWLGWAAVLAGLVGIVTGTIVFFDGFSEVTFNVLFPIASLLFTLWLGAMGYMLWQKASEPASAAATTPTAP